jgi:hypothetical protein
MEDSDSIDSGVKIRLLLNQEKEEKNLDNNKHGLLATMILDGFAKPDVIYNYNDRIIRTKCSKKDGPKSPSHVSAGSREESVRSQ